MKTEFSNIGWSQKILEALHAQGIRDVVFCAGARNASLVTVLSKTHGFELHSFFEERAGAFYALGIARRTGQPVAILTTSGTAAAECLPAVIEAYHSGIPLIVVTADRPRRLRGTGAPQAIDQVGLFAKFVQMEFDLESGEMFDLAKWNRRSPVHLNICFDEPLIDQPMNELELPLTGVQPSFAGRSTFSVSAGPEWAILRLTKFLRSQGNLVVVVGTLETALEQEAVVHFLTELKAPVYLEATSGLRGDPRLRELTLRSGDKLLAWALKRKLLSRVLRIGSVPTVRIWRDLDEPSSEVEVLSLSPLPFAGLSRGELVCAEIAPTLSAVKLSPTIEPLAGALFIKDRSAEQTLTHLIQSEKLAEPSMFHQLSRLIPETAFVYVGNSLPIREWDLAADFEIKRGIEANRGVNGIDGQITTFLGLAREGSENWAIVGDLTALYDLAGPWALTCRENGLKVRIVVINNGGGKIFSRIFKTDLFENRHSLGFEHWARMWDIGYRKWTSVPTEFEGGDVEIIELIPDDMATRHFWDRYDGLWS